MKRVFLSLILFFSAVALPLLNGQEKAFRRYDFSDNKLLKKRWHWRGKQFGVPMTRFYVAKSETAHDRQALILETNSSSGVKFDKEELDDQAAVIYFGDGTTLRQNMLAYSWENFPDLGKVVKIQYGMGTRNVYRICMRNRNAELSRWYEEERNVVEDFKKLFGRMPKGLCGLTIGANSQYSKSKTLVEIDFIEFCEAKTRVPSPAEQSRMIAERRVEK